MLFASLYISSKTLLLASAFTCLIQTHTNFKKTALRIEQQIMAQMLQDVIVWHAFGVQLRYSSKGKSERRKRQYHPVSSPARSEKKHACALTHTFAIFCLWLAM